MDQRTARPRLAIIEKDEWLLPVEQDVNARYERYKNRLEQIERDFGSLYDFAGQHNYLGINYDAEARGWFYREWAPGAEILFLFGDFNNWQRFSNPMQRKDNGIWEIFLPEDQYRDRFTHQSKIKVLVKASNGWNERIPAFIRRTIQDNFAPSFSGQVWLPEPFDWQGDDFAPSHENLFIYEAHVGMAQEKYGVGTYREFAEHTLHRVKDAGYNAIQLMAIAAHPYYGSFGYHVANFFAVESRSGTPEELKYLVRKAHQMGIAVIMDIVHSHTVKNINEGLNEFDGTVDQYFHQGGRGNHPAWDSKLFDYGKTEVIQFLLSNVRYWLEEFHFDGYRFDGVTSMLYWHHGHGVSFDNQSKFFSEGVEYDAITYLQLANKLIHQIKPEAISIAEDVSGMPGITAKQEEGGIGFNHRLAMGLPDYWTKLVKERQDEQWHPEEMFNAMVNRKFDEGTVGYVESHDQALVGDQTLAFRLMGAEMYGAMHKHAHNDHVSRGVALHKMIRLMTISLGGDAYLNFMGNEFGHPEWIDFPREGNAWSYHYARRQWSLYDRKELKYHWLGDFDRAMLGVIARFKVMTAAYPQKLKYDDWHKTIVFERAGIVFVFNYHVTLSMTDYEVPVHLPGTYRIVLNTDHGDFGGFMRINDWMDYPSYERDGKHFVRVYVTNRTALVLAREEDMNPAYRQAQEQQQEPALEKKKPDSQKKTTSKDKTTSTAKTEKAAKAEVEAPAKKKAPAKEKKSED